eukprot:365849-Chlamydomonas_euryale.AAC.7
MAARQISGQSHATAAMQISCWVCTSTAIATCPREASHRRQQHAHIRLFTDDFGLLHWHPCMCPWQQAQRIILARIVEPMPPKSHPSVRSTHVGTC